MSRLGEGPNSFLSRPTTVDALLSGDPEVAGLRLLKIDVEGVEAALLQGAARSIAKVEAFRAFFDVKYLAQGEAARLEGLSDIRALRLREKRLVKVAILAELAGTSHCW